MDALLQSEKANKAALSSEQNKNKLELQKLVAVKNAQIDLLNSTVTSGLKANWDDEFYSFFYINEGLCRMLGYTEAELMAKCDGKMTKLVYPPDLPQALKDCDRCFAQSDEYSTEYRVERKDGSLIWVWDKGRKAKNENGVTVINSVLADITESVCARETIKKQANFLQALYDSTPCGLVQFAIGGDYHLLNANKATQDITGYTERELFEVVRNLFAILHSDDVEQTRRGIEYVVQSRKSKQMRYRIYNKTGDIVHISAVISIVVNSEGTPVLQLAIIDVTEVDKTVQERNTTYDNIPGGVAKFMIDDKLTIVEANDNFYKMFGIVKHKNGGKENGLACIHYDDVDMVRRVMTQCSLTNKIIDVEYRAKKGSANSPVWIHLIGRFIGKMGGFKLYQCVLVDISKQKKAQLQLSRERERYRIAMEISADIVYEYDLQSDTAITYENIRTPEGSEVLKQTLTNYSKRRENPKFTHPDDLPAMMSVFRGENIMPVEVRMRPLSDPGDMLLWHHVQGTVVYADGKPVRVVGLIRNIDEARKIKEEKEQLQEIFDTELSRDYELICKVNTATSQYRVLTTNGSISSHMPMAGDFNKQMQWQAQTMVYPQDKEAFREGLSLQNMLEALERHKEEVVLYYRGQEQNGRLRWKCARYNYFNSNKGFILLNVRDVHDIRMEQQKEENRFNILLKETFENVVETDVETGSCDVFFPNGRNRYPVAEYRDYNKMLQSYAERYVLEEQRGGYLKQASIPYILAKIGESDEPFSFEFEVRGQDGSIAYKNRTMSLLTYDNNHRYIISYLRDITKQSLAQIEREQAGAKNRQIIEDALAAAEQANLAKTDFLSRMSHEIRTPMNAIIGLTAIASASLDSREKIVNCLSKIGISSRFLLAIINDILDMSRIENGKVSIAHDEFDFNSFLTGVTTIIYPQASARGQTFEATIDGLTAEHYIGDVLRMNQVLINILSNAVKFTPEGGVIKFCVKQVRQSKNHAYLKFTVCDNGIGMTQEQIGRIFAAFEQADSGISQKYGGSGLGLTISKSLVSLMNGSISVSSKPGEGSEFVVEIPVEVLEHDYRQDNTDTLKDLNILVGDDDVITCEHTVLILSSMGINAQYATSGRRIIEVVREAYECGQHYDIVFVDWKMPDMDGIETAKAIRQIVGPNTLVIIMSAYDWSDIEEKARAAGVNFFIAKPIFQSTVQEVLLKTIQKQSKEENIPSVSDYNFTGKRVLLVEDNEINREIAQALLEMKNTTVETAANGQIAVDLFAASAAGYYDAILMDVRMPVKDGLEATHEIRALAKPDAATVPIIAMTANAFIEDIASTKKSGMNEHLAKPIETDRLYAVLNRYFSKQLAGNQ